MKERNGKESNDEIKIIDWWWDWILSLNDLGNCKGIFITAYKQGMFYEKSKETDKFKTSETRKSAIKASKTQIGNKFSMFLLLLECDGIFD